MRRQKLTPKGPEFSRMIYGTWRLLETRPTTQEINRRLHACIELGITTFDTAEIYGLYEVEERLGAAIALSPGLRDAIELVTKGGIYVPCPHHPDLHTAHYDASADRLTRALERSLRLLRTDRVDLYLVHRPDPFAPAADTAGALRAMLRGGVARAVGVSNYGVHQFDLLDALLDGALATNQIEFHLLHDAPLVDGTLHRCERAGIRPMAWSPLGGGRILDTREPAGQRLAAAAAAMSARYDGATLEQLAHAWILAHPSRPFPIIGTNREERLRAAARADAIALAREDWYALLEAARGQRVP